MKSAVHVIILFNKKFNGNTYITAEFIYEDIHIPGNIRLT